MTSQQPILASERISDVLSRFPNLVDTLIDASPAFRNLRNPIMRHVQSRLVTVSQAAGIAGLNPADLTRKLNVAAGLTNVKSASRPSVSSPLWASIRNRRATLRASTPASIGRSFSSDAPTSENRSSKPC